MMEVFVLLDLRATGLVDLRDPNFECKVNMWGGINGQFRN
jgi:hypothetical protein